MKITKTQLRKLIKEATQGEMEFAKLEKAGMVERRPDTEKHRIKRVFLGKKALDNKLNFFNILQDWHKILVKDIDKDDLDIVRTGIDKMITNAETFLGLGEIKK